MDEREPTLPVEPRPQITLWQTMEMMTFGTTIAGGYCVLVSSEMAPHYHPRLGAVIGLSIILGLLAPIPMHLLGKAAYRWLFIDRTPRYPETTAFAMYVLGFIWMVFGAPCSCFQIVKLMLSLL